MLTEDQLWSDLKCTGSKNSKDKVYDQNHKTSICSGPILAFTLVINKGKNKRVCIENFQIMYTPPVPKSMNFWFGTSFNALLVKWERDR